MGFDWQIIPALMLLVLALGYLGNRIRHAWKPRSAKSCPGQCCKT